MANKRTVKSASWSLRNVPMEFDIATALQHSHAEELEVIRKYFPGANNISRLNALCSFYQYKKARMNTRPTEGNVRACLLKMAELFELMQACGVYPLTCFYHKLSQKAYDEGDPLREELIQIGVRLNEITQNFVEEGDNRLIETLRACATAAKGAAEEIPEQGKRGGSNLSSFLNPDRHLIENVADLYKQIHDEWPARQVKDDTEVGPLDQIFAILGKDVVLGCGQMPRLLLDWYTKCTLDKIAH